MGTDPCWQAGILAGLAARLPQTGEVAASIRRLDEAHRAALPEAYAAAVILLQWLLRGAPR